MDSTVLLALGAGAGGVLLGGVLLWVARAIARSARATNPAAPGAADLPVTPAAFTGASSREASTPAHRQTEVNKMPHTGTFATVINCIDGRAQRPVADWARVNAQATFVDTVTIPGPEKALTEATVEQIAPWRRYVGISLTAHGSRFVAVAGHHECAANAVSAEEHQRMIRAAVAVVRGWDLRDAEGRPVRVVGLWVNDAWLVEVVSDSGE